MQNIVIILVAPQMGENIGAAARIMKNFGLSNLRIVSPRDGWPNVKAQNMSVGAIEIVDNAKIFSSIKEATKDLSVIYATTGTPRDINKNCVLSSNLNNDIGNISNVGIMFGRENSGLTNNEISHANKILVIDTEKNFTSLNLAQAVCVVCYELFNVKKSDKIYSKPDSEKLASSEELSYFYDHLFDLLEEKKFFRMPDKKNNITQKIKNIFLKIENLSQSELQILHGIVKVLSNNQK